MKFIILFVIFLSLNNVVRSQTPGPLPIISILGVNKGPNIELVLIDLNTGYMTNTTTNILNEVSFVSAINLDSSEYIDLIYLNMTGPMNYYIGRYFYENTSMAILIECQNSSYTFFEYLDVVSYYDSAANKISTVGESDQSNNITIVTYDLNENNVDYYVTDYIPLPTTLPGSSIYGMNQVSSFFYNSQGKGMGPSILISDVVLKTSSLYLINDFHNLNELTAPSPFTVSINDQLYLFAANGDSYYYLFQVALESNSAKLKLIFKTQSYYIGIEPFLISQDQSQIIFFGGKYRNSKQSFLFTIYNLETSESQVINIENKLDLNLFNFDIFFSNK